MSKGYKIFGPNFECLGYKYSNGMNVHRGDITIGLSGFHYCTKALDCLEWYSLYPDNCFAEIEIPKKAIIKSNGNNYVTSHLKITKIFTVEEFRQMCNGILYGIPYKNGNIHGKFTYQGDTFIYCDGTLIEYRHLDTIIYPYDGDINTGEVQVLLQNVKIKQYILKNGLKEGTYESWYPNGKRKYRKNYTNNIINGVVESWNESGDLISQDYFIGDQKISQN